MIRSWALVAVACAAALAAGCGSSTASAPAETLPVRAPSAGDSLLEAVPAGADLVVEIDLARLRENPVTGPALSELQPVDAVERADLLTLADSALICIYGIGGDTKQLVILRRGEGELQGAVELGQGRYAVGDPSLLARAEAAAGGAESSLAVDESWLRLRSQAMPEKAKSAALRVSGRFGFDARVALASKAGLSEFPQGVSIWADVVDDMALIVQLEHGESAEVGRMERAVKGVLERLASRHLLIRALGLAPVLKSARVIRGPKELRVVFVLSPKRFAFVVQRGLALLRAQAKK